MNKSIPTRHKSSNKVFSCILDTLIILKIKKHIPNRFDDADRI
jgi:hypothetical protein